LFVQDLGDRSRTNASTQQLISRQAGESRAVIVALSILICFCLTTCFAMSHEVNLNNYERSLMDEHNYGLKGLLGKHDQPHLHLKKSFAITAYAVAIFVFTIAAFAFPWRFVAWGCGVVAICLLFALFSEFYRACLQAAFLNKDPGYQKSLSTFLNHMLQQDAGWREQWDWYNDHTGSSDSDPGTHDQAYLQDFIAMVHGGQLPDGGRLLSSTSASPYQTRSVTVHTVWWPWWRFFMGVLAAVLGALLGRYIWHDMFNPYFELADLQVYSNVDPAVVAGDRLQDAGLVDFSPGVGVDRARGGCFKDGVTYCVAPILKGGAVLPGLADATQSGSYDFFVVGIDCCSCPNQDYRCGQFNNPLADGGLRSIDYKSRPFYRLATEDWAAAYNKPVKHAIFFEWVQNPRGTHYMMLSRGVNMILLAIVGAATFFFMLAAVLSCLLHALVKADVIASPGTAQAAANGDGFFWRNALPLWQGGEAAEAWGPTKNIGAPLPDASQPEGGPQGPASARPILPPPTDPVLQGYGSTDSRQFPKLPPRPSVPTMI